MWCSDTNRDHALRVAPRRVAPPGVVERHTFVDSTIQAPQFHENDTANPRDGREVDIVLQARDGRVVAIEVKSARAVDEGDIRWLTWLRDRLGDAFVRGIVLHIGDRVTPFGDRILAAPVSMLWSG
jgi:hypothetical protein